MYFHSLTKDVGRLNVEITAQEDRKDYRKKTYNLFRQHYSSYSYAREGRCRMG